MRNILTSFLLAFFVLSNLHAQIRPRFDESSGEEEQVDTGESKKKDIKSVIKNWKIQDYGAFFIDSELDTLQDFFHLFHPAYKNELTNTYTGNYGGAYLNNNFFRRDYNNEFYFLHTREAYLLTPENIQYFNTTTPYTLLDYSQSENKNSKNETRFNVLHSQNITPKFNVTFRFDQAKSDGQYNFQANKNNFVSLYSSYRGDKINVHGGFIVSRIRNEENGGLLSDDLLLSGKENLIVRLTDTKSEWNNTYLFSSAEYKLGAYEGKKDSSNYIPIAGLIYSFKYSGNQKLFKEGIEADNSLYFPLSFMNPRFSNDSVRFDQITSLFQLKLYEKADKRASFGKRGYLGQEFVKVVLPSVSYQGKKLMKATFPSPDWSGIKIENYTNLFIGGGFNRLEGNFWNWNLDGRIYLTGYKKGQTEIKAVISKPLSFLKDSLASFNIEGKIGNKAPDFFQQKYFSNHKVWENNLKSEQHINAKASFRLPSRKFEIAANYAFINNFIYHDTLGIPAQTRKDLLVFGAYFDKDFAFKNLHFRTRLLYQKATPDENVHLPEFSAFASVFFKMIVSKVLYTQLGIDLRYDSKYYADAYDPLTGFFYLQNEKELGGYPYVDAYASIKLKRTRIFFLLMNVGSDFLDKEYFTTLHYPMNARTFRLGVAWTFYN